jgi:hypothetical protein
MTNCLVDIKSDVTSKVRILNPFDKEDEHSIVTSHTNRSYSFVEKALEYLHNNFAMASFS